MKFIKRQLIWIIIVLPALTGCGSLEDLGKIIDDMLGRFS